MNKMQVDPFDDFDTEVEPVDLKPYVRALVGGWKKILIWAICGSLVGIGIAFSIPRTYSAKAVVAPEITTRANSSGLSSLASLAGINVNTLALTDAMHPDLYPEIIKSSNFYIRMFDLPVEVRQKDSLVQTDLYDYMVHYTKAPWWSYVFGLPRKAIDAVKGLFVDKDPFETAEGHAHVDSLRLTREQETVIKALTKCVSASVEKRTYVLSLKVTMQDPVIAAQFANAIADNLRQFVVEYRTQKEQENVDFYTKIYEETREEYLSAQRAYARYADANNGIVSKTAQIQLQQLQNEAQLRYQLYNQTSQHLLSARVKVQQETPVIVVIQPGMAPLDGKPSKVKLALLWFILGAMAGGTVVLVHAYRNREKQ